MEGYTINVDKVLNTDVRISEIPERKLFEEIIRRKGFHTTKEVMIADTTGETTLQALKVLYELGLAAYIKLNGRYYWTLTVMGTLELDKDKGYG